MKASKIAGYYVPTFRIENALNRNEDFRIASEALNTSIKNKQIQDAVNRSLNVFEIIDKTTWSLYMRQVSIIRYMFQFSFVVAVIAGFICAVTSNGFGMRVSMATSLGTVALIQVCTDLVKRVSQKLAESKEARTMGFVEDTLSSHGFKVKVLAEDEELPEHLC